MTPDFSQLPPDERALRLTALLLGELAADEAAEIQLALDADPELAREHARLQQTIALVRETTALERKVAADGTPLQLDAARREKLLAAFQKPASRADAPRRRRKWFVPASVAAALIGLLGLVFTLPHLARSKARAQRLARVSERMGVTEAEMGSETLALSERGLSYALPRYGGETAVPTALAAKAPEALARNLAGVPAADGRVQVSGQVQAGGSFVVNEVMAGPAGGEPAPVTVNFASSSLNGNMVVNGADTTVADGLAPLPATAPVPAAGERPLFRKRSDSFGVSSRAAGPTDPLGRLETTHMSGRQSTIPVKDISYAVTDLDTSQTPLGGESRSKARNLYLGESESREPGVRPARPAAVITVTAADLDKVDLFERAVKTPLPANAPAQSAGSVYSVNAVGYANLGQTVVQNSTINPTKPPADAGAMLNYAVDSLAPVQAAPGFQITDNGLAKGLGTTPVAPITGIPASDPAPAPAGGAKFYRLRSPDQPDANQQVAAAVPPPAMDDWVELYNPGPAGSYKFEIKSDDSDGATFAQKSIVGGSVGGGAGGVPGSASPSMHTRFFHVDPIRTEPELLGVTSFTFGESSHAGGGGGGGRGGGGRSMSGNAASTTPAKSALLLEQDRAVRGVALADMVSDAPTLQPSAGAKSVEGNQDHSPALGFDFSLGDKALSDGRVAQDGAVVTRNVMARDQAESKDAKALASDSGKWGNAVHGVDNYGLVTSWDKTDGTADSPVSANFYSGLTRDDVGAVRFMTRADGVKLSDDEAKSKSLTELRNEIINHQGRGDVKLEKAGAVAFNDSAWLSSDGRANGSVAGSGTPNFWWKASGETPAQDRLTFYDNGRPESAANPVAGAIDATVVNQGAAVAPSGGTGIGTFGGSMVAGVSGAGGAGGFGGSRTGFGNRLNVAVNRAEGAAGGAPAANSPAALRGFFPPRHNIAEDVDGPLEVKGLKPESAENLPKGSALATDSDGDANGRVAVQLPGLVAGEPLGRQSSPTRPAGERNAAVFAGDQSFIAAYGEAGKKQIDEAVTVLATPAVEETKEKQSKQILIEAQLWETAKNPHIVKGIDWSGTLTTNYVSFGNGSLDPAPAAVPTAQPQGRAFPTPQSVVRANGSVDGNVMIASGSMTPITAPTPTPEFKARVQGASASGPEKLAESRLPTPNAYARTNRFVARNAFLVTNGMPLFDALPETNIVRGLAMGKILSVAPATDSRAPVAIDKPLPKPPPGAPTPQPEVLTRDNAFSTFSLNVSDVSFKLAAASLEKGQMPDAAGIRSEEFLNAFDYRDPMPAAGVPVAFAWERARYPFAHNRDALRFSVKTAAQGREAGKPLNIVLLLDNSGSMERADRVRIIQESLRALAAQLKPQDKLSVVTFARTARLWADGVTGAQAAEVAKQIGALTPEGGTNLEEAMDLAYRTALRHYAATAVNRVVLLTDGAANLGNVEPKALKAKVEGFRKQGVALDCFGIGWDGFNDDLLEQLSRNGDGRYGFINTPEEAATEFVGQLAGALHVAASDVKVQVEFNPKRVTAYRQIGYAKHQLTKQQFRDNTVDAAEIGAAEAGNGLYIIETNPRGEGPIATVRARFRIPQTSDYREHEWVVPFGSAVDLEQSSSAMRLATSASAFSEWLASSPYSGEVTTDRLLGLMSGVPEVYGADPRPKKLEWMIRQAKSISGK